MNNKQEDAGKHTSAKPIPHIPLPFEEVMKDVLKVKPPAKEKPKEKKVKRRSRSTTISNRS